MENLFPTEYYAFVLLTLFTFVIWQIFANKERKTKKLIGRVTQLRTHPVKSGKPLHMQEVEVTKLGLKHDRQYALLNKYGTFTTLRKYPKFVLVEPQILSDKIKFKADGMPDLYLPLQMEKKDGDHLADVTVWSITTQGVHVSEEADEWFANFLNLDGCKLYCFPKDGVPRFSKDKGAGSFEMMFSDGCPLLIVSQASLNDLNNKYVDEDLTMDRFRPNIVIDECQPYAEDTFDEIQIGDMVRMKALWPCERCVAINVDSSQGVMSSFNLLDFLNKNRPGTIFNTKYKLGIFGRNYGVVQAGCMKVGDPIYAVMN